MVRRTQNENGSYNTRCLYCLMPLGAEAATQEELTAREAAHICPEKALSELWAEQAAEHAAPRPQ